MKQHHLSFARSHHGMGVLLAAGALRPPQPPPPPPPDPRSRVPESLQVPKKHATVEYFKRPPTNSNSSPPRTRNAVRRNRPACMRAVVTSGAADRDARFRVEPKFGHNLEALTKKLYEERALTLLTLLCSISEGDFRVIHISNHFQNSQRK